MAREQVVLRVQGETKKAAVAAAKKAGISLNDYCERRINGTRIPSGAASTSGKGSK